MLDNLPFSPAFNIIYKMRFFVLWSSVPFHHLKGVVLLIPSDPELVDSDVDDGSDDASWATVHYSPLQVVGNCSLGHEVLDLYL